jgi:hypothetical protein
MSTGSGLRRFTLALVLAVAMSGLVVAVADAAVHDVRVLLLAYYPDENKDGLLDPDIVGPGYPAGVPVTEMKQRVVDLTTGLVSALETGSIYHGYKGGTTPSLQYTIVDAKTFDAPIPLSTQFRPFADHLTILDDLDICHYVDTEDVKEVWVWMYHTAVVAPIESNMSGPYGDVSNSYRQDDLPHCAGTYTVYDYNYGRGVSEATENHMHQIEAVLNWVDGRDVTPPQQWGTLLFWGNFVGSDASHHILRPGCGWSHYPPNGTHDYDWANTAFVQTDCEDWRPDGSGQRQSLNCQRWSCDSLTFFVWWMQNVPGFDNGLVHQGRQVRNWWDFIGDFDAAMAIGKSLTLAGPPPGPITGFKGRASGFGQGPKHGFVRFSGRAELEGEDVTLAAGGATVEITRLLFEEDSAGVTGAGAGEVVEGLPLRLVRRFGNATLAIFETPPGYRDAHGFDVFARVRLAARPLVGPGVHDFQVDVFNITFDPLRQCPAPNVAGPPTQLTFSLTLDDGFNPPVVLTATEPWQCSNRNRTARTP